MSKQRGLGRGLDSLIPTQLATERPIDDAAKQGDSPSAGADASSAASDAVHMVEVGQIDPNPHQPRTEFNQDELSALAASIKEHGVLQPLVVSRQGDRYQLIAGERRLRASKQAGQSVVPVIIRSFDEQQKLELAIIENVQRADLNPLETAVAYKKLIDEFNLSLEQVAKRVGRAKSTVSNLIRLLQLPAAAQQAIMAGQISEAHGRAILAAPTNKQAELLRQIVEQGLNVRQAEAAAKQLSQTGEAATAPADSKNHQITAPAVVSPELIKEVSGRLGVTVQSKPSAKGGSLVLKYKDQQQLDRLLEKLKTA